MYRGMDLKTGFDKETRDLHGMSKEWLALREDLVAFHAQLGFLRNAHSGLLGLKTEATNWHVAGIHEACNPFDVLVSQAEICSRWTTVYRDRTDICIQMVSTSIWLLTILVRSFTKNATGSCSTSPINESHVPAARLHSKPKRIRPP